MPDLIIESFIKSAFFPLAYVRHKLTWHDGASGLSLSDKVESTFMLSNVILSLLLFPLFDWFPQENVVVKAVAAISMDVEIFFISFNVLVVIVLNLCLIRYAKLSQTQENDKYFSFYFAK